MFWPRWLTGASPQTGIVSLVESQTAIQQREVFLVQRLDKSAPPREPMPYMKCIVFARPTAENIMHLHRELEDPKYSEYHIFFTNVCRPTFLEELAEADEFSLVRQVQEIFADFFAFNVDLFSLEEPTRYMISEREIVLSVGVKDRCVDGLVALQLALRKRATVRYTAASVDTMRLGELVASRMDSEGSGLFDFHRGGPDRNCVLLILDRRDDPVTPLLNQWTYQAMVHELVGIDRNRVALPNEKPDLREVILSVEEDEFFRHNMYLNFGDLLENMKEMVDSFQKQTKSKAPLLAALPAACACQPERRALLSARQSRGGILRGYEALRRELP